MRVGMRVVATADIELKPHTTVRRGEEGAVVAVDPGTGEITILLDRHHKGLAEWHNTIWLLPDCTDISSRLRVVAPYAVDRGAEFSQDVA